MKPRTMEFCAGGPLRGTVAVPGDKSISHRALMLSAMAVGRSHIVGLSEGEDVRSTARALEAMGVRVRREGAAVLVGGVGTGGLLQPRAAFDMGNSGTSARLLMGLVAAHPITATFTGDASLSRRPMARVIAPLTRLGARVEASPGGRLPLTLTGARPALALAHRLTVASAQVKSALLLAGLNTPGTPTVIEPTPTRAHSERVLQIFGAEVQGAPLGAAREIAIRGEAKLAVQEVTVPGDPSSAAFLTVAALIVPGSEVRLEGIGVNPMRMGLYETLREMGADIRMTDERMASGEPVADLVVRHSGLKGVRVPAERVPAMIDEFPIFFVAAAFAQGESRAEGVAELRVKESDRIAAMTAGLRAIGADVEEDEDGLAVRGSGGAPLKGGARIASQLDHRIAMSFAVAGLRCDAPVTVDDMTPTDTSFPGFVPALQSLCR